METHWKSEKYLAWLDTMRSADNEDHGQIPAFVHDSYSLSYGLTSYIYDDSIGGSYSADYMQRIGFTDSMLVYAEPNRFCLLVISASSLAQGWDDCDLDWKTQGLWNALNSWHPFGRSEIAENLRSRLRGLYYYENKY